MSQTMFAIKKGGGPSNSSHSNTSNSSNSAPTSNKKASVTSSATSVWQKKKRKRGNKNKNKTNKNNELISDDNSSITTNDEGKECTKEISHNLDPKTETINNNITNINNNNNNNDNDASKSSYDPTSNPYSLENYKKNHELQKKVENNVAKHTQTENDESPPPQSIMVNHAKSPMCQVRLTPLFPTPPSNGYNNPRLPPSFPPNTMSTTAHSQSHTPNHTHCHSANIQYLSSSRPHPHSHHNHPHPHNTDPTQCPHGNLTAEQLINIKIRKRNVCYVVGLPIHVATEIKLRTQEWFGQFGNIATIAINRNSKSIQANSIPAHITYDNDISALNAINFCNKFIFDDGRKLKATFGTQHYCRWFIAANKKCTNVFCGFRHSWCKPCDIITQKDINDFKAIPAGAYTSRNIENQPLGVRSVNVSVQHSLHSPPQIITATTPVYSTSNNLSAEEYNGGHTGSGSTSKSGESINGVANASGIKISASTDPYTFYLSNAAATPTGPGQAVAAPTTCPGIPTLASIASIPVPNIYDSRNVLMKQIMNRNHNLQIENDRLTQQIKILSEMEIKNKQEIHRWWTELAQSQQTEKNLAAKYDKMCADFKGLESKHDSLQIKYLALDEKYKHLLNCKNFARKKEFESWDCNDVIKWIMKLNNKKYEKYETDLCENIQTENIDGQCLESLDKGDLHRLGVTDFKDKKDLLQKIKELVTPNQ